MAIISSTTDMPKSKMVDSSFIIPSSSRTLTVTTVLVIDMASARNIESKDENPNASATKNENNKVPIVSAKAITTEILPTDLSLAIGNSVPMTNKSMIIPNSAKTFTVLTFRIKLNGG